MKSVEVFAPATVANLGPGFDVLGLAVEGLGDRVIARRAPGPLRITRVEGARLPTDVAANTAGIAACAALRRCGRSPVDAGIQLELHKGMPAGSGLGSSAASAAAAVVAVVTLLEVDLPRAALLEACIDAEAVVSGRHADNVAPSLFGGLVLVRRLDPLDWIELPVPTGGHLVLAMPEFSLATRAARAALPTHVPLADALRNGADLASLVAAGFRNDLEAFGRSMSDAYATPVRLPMIPGGAAVLAAAQAAGALGAGISGSGPTLFALVDGDPEAVAAAMRAAFADAGLQATTHVSPLAAPGAHVR